MLMIEISCGSGYRKNVQHFNIFIYRIQNNNIAEVQNPQIAVLLVPVYNR